MGGPCESIFGEVADDGSREMVDGRKTAAQRSNSRQSKYDLASRYFDLSLASSLVSLGLNLVDRTGRIDGIGCSASCMCESRSRSVSGSEPGSVVGEIELDNSAILEDWDQAERRNDRIGEFHTISRIDKDIVLNIARPHLEGSTVFHRPSLPSRLP